MVYKFFDKKTLGGAVKSDIMPNKTVKLQAFDSSYLHGKSHFEDDGIQNYLVFLPIYRFFKNKMVILIFQHGNLKDCLMKVLKPLLHLIIVLLHH